jgi:hypothetical protein
LFKIVTKKTAFEERRRIPILFILGCPRSGTTLTSQLLINGFSLGYISNRIAPFYGGLGLAEKVFKTNQKFTLLSYESRHGRTPERHGPHECGEFWYQFFPRDPHYADLRSVKRPACGQLRKHLAAFQRTVGLPLVFKNVMLSARLPVLQEVFPEAVFLVVHREREATVQSILKARERVGMPPREWWSLRPKGFELSGSRNHRDIAEAQYDLTYRMIDEDLLSRRIDVHYEAICKNPRRELERIEEALRNFGVPIERRAFEQTPQEFNGK